MPDKTPLYVIDIDGTVADNSHRMHFISDDGRVARVDGADWDAFFAAHNILADAPIAAARACFDQGRFIYGDHMFLTARVDSVMRATRGWLFEYGFLASEETVLICKPDIIRFQPAPDFKVAVLRTLRADFPDRELVLVEDYGAARRAAIVAGFRTMHAPDCWSSDEGWYPEGVSTSERQLVRASRDIGKGI